MDDKEKKHAKLLVLQNLNKEVETHKVELTDEEKALKDKLLEIEKKLDSMENVLKSISQDNPGTIFADQMFNTIFGAIAVTAATGTIAEFFGVPKKDVDDLLF